jgi:hypothetical protein
MDRMTRRDKIVIEALGRGHGSISQTASFPILLLLSMAAYDLIIPTYYIYLHCQSESTSPRSSEDEALVYSSPSIDNFHIKQYVSIRSIQYIIDSIMIRIR